MSIEGILWIIAAVVLGVVEAFTLNLVTIWTAVGAVCAAVAAALGLSFFWQMVIFLAVSIILLLATRPLAKRLLDKKTEPTNVDRLVGAHGRVIREIEPVENRGQIKVLGQVWSAAACDGGSIEEGAEVLVTKIRGVRAVVCRVDHTEAE